MQEATYRQEARVRQGQIQPSSDPETRPGQTSQSVSLHESPRVVGPERRRGGGGQWEDREEDRDGQQARASSSSEKVKTEPENRCL